MTEVKFKVHCYTDSEEAELVKTQLDEDEVIDFIHANMNTDDDVYNGFLEELQDALDNLDDLEDSDYQSIVEQIDCLDTSDLIDHITVDSNEEIEVFDNDNGNTEVIIPLVFDFSDFT